MTNIREVLSYNMKERRRELNISQADLAEKIGTSPNYISKIEAEKQFPSVQMIENIASALFIDSIDLFSISKYQEKELNIVKNQLCSEINTLINDYFNKIKA